MNRREVLRLSAVLLGTVLSPACTRAVESGEDLHAASAGASEDNASRQIAALSELIIPTTYTPGAISAGVPEFVSNIVAHWYTDAERERFLAGLARLDAASMQQFGVPFAEVTNVDPDAQRSLLETEMAAAGEPGSMQLRGGGAGGEKPFFYMLRELVVLGYFTSEPGATQALTYLPMPGRYDGEYPLADVGTSWSS